MQNITIIAMGKVQKGFQLDGCNEYIKRLKTLCNLKIVQLEDVQLAEKNYKKYSKAELCYLYVHRRQTDVQRRTGKAF